MFKNNKKNQQQSQQQQKQIEASHLNSSQSNNALATTITHEHFNVKPSIELLNYHKRNVDDFNPKRFVESIILKSSFFLRLIV